MYADMCSDRDDWDYTTMWQDALPQPRVDPVATGMELAQPLEFAPLLEAVKALQRNLITFNKVPDTPQPHLSKMDPTLTQAQTELEAASDLMVQSACHTPPKPHPLSTTALTQSAWEDPHEARQRNLAWLL